MASFRSLGLRQTLSLSIHGLSATTIELTQEVGSLIFLKICCCKSSFRRELTFATLSPVKCLWNKATSWSDLPAQHSTCMMDMMWEGPHAGKIWKFQLCSGLDFWLFHFISFEALVWVCVFDSLYKTLRPVSALCMCVCRDWAEALRPAVRSLLKSHDNLSFCVSDAFTEPSAVCVCLCSGDNVWNTCVKWVTLRKQHDSPDRAAT